MSGGLLFSATINGKWEVTVLNQFPVALVLIANTRGELVYSGEVEMGYEPRYNIDAADLDAIQASVLTWIDAQ